MPLVKAIEENFNFLVIEVEKQIEDTLKILKNNQSQQICEKIEARDDYIDSLKNIIENKAASLFLSTEKIDKKIITYIRALTIITSNLENIADYAVNIMSQTKFFTREYFLEDYNYKIFLKKISYSLSVLTKSVYQRDINIALDICKVEVELDRLYGEIIADIIKKLAAGKEAENLITTLFIFQYFERIGDSLLNIGEAIMSIMLGERIKIHQYEAISDTVTTPPEDHEYEIEPVAESRSGNIIRRVKETAFENPNWVIFKEGKALKIDKEKAGLELWSSIDPDVVPKIYGYEKKDDNAAIVIEFLKGRTLKDLVINNSKEYLSNVLKMFIKNVIYYWKKTMEIQQICPTYFKQINKRISDVYTVHTNFKSESSYIGDIEIMSLDKMINAAAFLDLEIKVPFSVIVHGDFNLDNVIFNEEYKKFYYIDLQRARRADYVQDVSVFLVSNFRLPFFEKDIRSKINHVILSFYKAILEFAKSNNDSTFKARLTAGLIRSYIT